jgi:hypothetical protein
MDTKEQGVLMKAPILTLTRTVAFALICGLTLSACSSSTNHQATTTSQTAEPPPEDTPLDDTVVSGFRCKVASKDHEALLHASSKTASVQSLSLSFSVLENQKHKMIILPFTPKTASTLMELLARKVEHEKGSIPFISDKQAELDFRQQGAALFERSSLAEVHIEQPYENKQIQAMTLIAKEMDNETHSAETTLNKFVYGIRDNSNPDIRFSVWAPYIPYDGMPGTYTPVTEIIFSCEQVPQATAQ